MKGTTRMKRIIIISCAWVFGVIPAWAGSVSAQITGTFNLQDPTIVQDLTLTIKGAPSITFGPVQPLQCGVTTAGSPVTTASLNNGGANPVWSMTGLTDFVINPTSGAITV